MLESWSPQHREVLATWFAASVPITQQPFVVFDADQTLWYGDIMEGVLDLLEQEKLFPSENLRLQPVHRGNDEKFSAYRHRLALLDTRVYLRWCAQMLAGVHKDTLKVCVDKLFRNATAPCLQINEVLRELICWLQSKNFAVYVATASVGAVVAMVVADPQYGFSIPGSQVLGYELEVTTAGYFTAKLAPIETCYLGKVRAVQKVRPGQAPLLAAGDSQSDFALLDWVGRQGGLQILTAREPRVMQIFLNNQLAGPYFLHLPTSSSGGGGGENPGHG